MRNKKNHNGHSKETWQRSLTKTVSYRIVVLMLDFTVVYLLTKKVEIAIGFMLVSNVYTSVAYYVHERIWDVVKWGKFRQNHHAAE